MQETRCKLVIESVREDGKRFRPSDWIERISSLMGEFGPDHRLHYAHEVRPAIIDGEKCLVVDEALKERNPQAYEYILEFARSNHLKIHLECPPTAH